MSSTTGFRHEALFYGDGTDGFARAIAPLVSETLAAGGTAAVAAPPDRIAALRDVLGEDEHVDLIDMLAVGANPARIIPVWRDLADRALAAGAPFLGVGEPVWAGRGGDELDECHRHEALINVAFADDPAWRLVCPYDVDGLDTAVLEDARLTHPSVFDAEQGWSHAPVDGEAAYAALERPLAPVPTGATALGFGADDLTLIRELARRQAAKAGLSLQRSGDLLVAVTEIATNSIRHGGGRGTLHMWQRDGAVVCQTADAGRLDDPMVGRRRPTFSGSAGRGMWIAHQLCDLVQIRNASAGTIVRVTVA
jgi:anti-sigma regulatory factor (Ser/Thr protein kinase)